MAADSCGLYCSKKESIDGGGCTIFVLLSLPPYCKIVAPKIYSCMRILFPQFSKKGGNSDYGGCIGMYFFLPFVVLTLPEVLCIVMFNLGVFAVFLLCSQDSRFRLCDTWFVGVGGDGFDGCWCGAMVLLVYSRRRREGDGDFV